MTLVRLTAPAGTPKTIALTSQIVDVNGARKIALYASQTTARGVGSSYGESAGPLPLAARPLVVTLTAGWCSPAPVELVWGLASRNATVRVRSASTVTLARRVARPPQFDRLASLFYAFVSGAPVTVLAQEDRHATTTQLVNNGVVPYGCNPGRIGPGPTPMVPYTP